jgi:hypothetical protein
MENVTASMGCFLVNGWIIPLVLQPLSTIVVKAASFR